MVILDYFRLDGQVAVITGGGGGLGTMLACAFAEVGADVAVVGRSVDALERAAAQVEAIGRRCAVISADITVPEESGRVIDEAIERLGQVNVLVNNAGGLAGDDAPRRAMDVSEASWQAQIDLNLSSTWRLSKNAARRMEEGGAILNMSSILAYQLRGGSAAYAIAKAGLNALTTAMAHELAPRLRVNGIAPGPVPTEKFKEVRGVTEADYDRIAQEWNVPLARLGRPEDIASAAIFLVSPASGWITGQTLIVAGGM